MIASIEIGLAQVGSFDELMASQEPALFETHPGGSLLELPPMLFPVDHKEVEADHRGAGLRYPPLGLTSFKDTLIYEKMFIGDGQRVFTSPKLHPFYVDHWIRRGEHGATSYDFQAKRRRFIEGPVFVVSNAHHIYGHWLLECVPKLLYLKHIQHDLPPIRIVLNGSPTFAEAWVRQLLPNAEVITFDPQEEYVWCERLLIPTMLCSTNYDFHLLLSQLVDELVGEVANLTEQIYLTRESESGFRVMENADEIRTIAQDAGLRSISPETLSIPDQVALFARSQLVVGDFGSALHNTIFSGPRTAVVAMNFINCLQSRIARLRQQRVGFILPDSGFPILYRESAPRRGFRINPEAFRHRLGIAIENATK